MPQFATPREVVKLHRPCVGHAVIKEYTLREPSAEDILPVGFPFDIQYLPDGGRVFVQNHAAIHHYAEKCVVDVDTIALFTQMSVADTIVLREKIMGFFLEAQKMLSTSATSSDGSSLTSDGSPSLSTG